MITSLWGHASIWLGAPQICHHLGKSCEHRHYDSGDIVFSICHVASCEHMFKGLCEFMGEIPSQRVTNFLCFVATGLV